MHSVGNTVCSVLGIEPCIDMSEASYEGRSEVFRKKGY